MTALTTLKIAVRALVKNKMRASLTVLGVVIGIAAVTAMVSIGQSAGQLVQNQFDALGTNVINIFPESQRRGGVRTGTSVTLTVDDCEAIRRECPAVLGATPIAGASGQIVYGNLNWNAGSISGVNPDYLTIRSYTLARGRNLTEADVRSAAKVCVVGKRIVAELFQTTDPTGRRIRIGNIPFEIIGVLDEKGSMMGQDQDNVVLMPYTTVMRRIYGSTFNNVGFIMASARSVDEIPQAETQIEQLLMERHGLDASSESDFKVQSATEIAAMFGKVTGTMTALLAAIAGISLAVGGVGIMNIMLVSVTERTREIGIRMAVGATSGDILRQFLVESVVLSVIGGIVGLTLGISLSVGVTMLINELLPDTNWPVVVSIPAAIVAIVFAAGVGIFFGFYPARKASRLDPIDALRYE